MGQVVTPEKKNLILTENFASNPEIAARAREHVKTMWQSVVQARSELDDRYLQFYNIWKTVFDIRYYEGRSQVYTPELRKNVEFAVRNLRRNLFPTDDYFTVEPTDANQRDGAQKNKRFLHWQQNNKTRLKRYVTPFLRQLVMYGWSPVKVIWKEEKKSVFAFEKKEEVVYQNLVDPHTGEEVATPTGVKTIIEQVKKDIKTSAHPTFLPVDVMSFYVYPWTAWDAADVYATLEEMSLSKADLKSGEANGTYTGVDSLILNDSVGSASDKRRWTKTQRLATMGLADNMNADVPFWNVVECWTKFDLHGNGDEIDCVITLVEDEHVIQVRQNPYFDQEPPYLIGKLDELVGEFYASGLIEPLQTLQYFLNDTKNQLNDAMTYSLNPVIKYDPGMVVNPRSLVIAPGAMWALREPRDSAVFDRPPDVAGSGRYSVQETRQEIDEFPGFEKVPTTGRRPATQVTAIQQDRGISILDWSENIETQVMSPFLRKQWLLTQQFLDDEVWFKAIGKPPEKMSLEDLIGDYQFYWLGANQTQNLVVRSQQMMNYLGIALQIPQSPTERINFMWIAKRIWTEGLGLDGEDKLTEKLDLTEVIPADQENIILLMGKQIQVNQLDDHDESAHAPLMQVPNLPDNVRKIIMDHIMAHKNMQFKRQLEPPPFGIGGMQGAGGAGDMGEPEGPPAPEEDISPGSPTGGE